MPTHKLSRWMMSLAGVGTALLYPISAHAQVVTGNNIFAAEGFIADIVVKILTALNLLTWILFGFLNYLLDPRFMFDMTKNGQEGDFMTILNQIWQLSRDLANVGFAVVLVVAAVIMIATAKKDVIADKVTKFVLAVILVNFSWFIPRVILDVANVATSAIFGIPSLINQAGGQECKYTSGSDEGGCSSNGDGTYSCDCILITNMQIFVDNWEELDKDTAWECPGNELFCYKYEKMTPDSVASYSAILNGLIVNHGRLRELGRVPASLAGGSKISELIVFLIRELILVAFHIAFFFPLLAMTIAFFIRIPVLWITIAFMPFVFLGKMIPMIKGETDKIWENFLKAAFLPALVAIPLSIGFVMINAGEQLTGQDAAGISVRLFDGVSNLWQLMWMCMSMGVLWVGVFEVLTKHGGIMAKGAETIKGIGESYGKLALKAPLAAPILPGATSPLKLLRSISPAALNQKLEDSVSGKPAGSAAAGESAKKIKEPQLKDLNTHLKDLKKAIETKDARGEQDAYKKLQAMGVNISDRNGLTAFKAEFDRRSDLDKTKQRETTKHLEDAIKAAPSTPDPRTTAMSTSATEFKNNTRSMDTLNRNIADLATVMNDASKTAAQKQTAIDSVNSAAGFNVVTSLTSAKSDLNEFMNNHLTPAGVDAAKITDMQTNINTIK